MRKLFTILVVLFAITLLFGLLGCTKQENNPFFRDQNTGVNNNGILGNNTGAQGNGAGNETFPQPPALPD